MNQIDCEYGNTQEINFIDGIMSGKWVKVLTNEDKIKSLKGYIESCHKRSKWAAIEKDVVIKRAQFHLAALRGF